MSTFTRRDFLKTGGLAGLLAGTTFGTTALGRTRAADWQGQAKNVIIMVSDGMSSGTLALADQMRMIQDGRRSTWISMYQDQQVTRGLMDTASLNSMVTDSAAAGSSWGCGRRVNNGAINMGPSGETYTPIFTYFRDAGKKTGLVSTARVTHATPASFIANVVSRGQEADIAVQMLERGADVILGGGDRFFDGQKRDDGRDLFSEFQASGYHVARTKAEMQQARSTDRLIGIFSQEHMPYDVDHRNSPELAQNVPTIAEMTDQALRHLTNDSGFILQVEGARIDHAAHGSCAAGLIFDQLAFDDAVAVALEFVRANPDTLLIVTTDHGNANPALNGTGSGYMDSQLMLEKVAGVKSSNETLLPLLDEGMQVSRMRELIEHHTGIGVSAEHAEMLRSAMRREYSEAYGRMNGTSAVMGRIMANYTAVSFTSTAHTSDHVELSAMGPGSDSLGAFVMNTELFNIMTQAAGVRVG